MPSCRVQVLVQNLYLVKLRPDDVCIGSGLGLMVRQKRFGRTIFPLFMGNTIGFDERQTLFCGNINLWPWDMFLRTLFTQISLWEEDEWIMFVKTGTLLRGDDNFFHWISYLSIYITAQYFRGSCILWSAVRSHCYEDVRIFPVPLKRIVNNSEFSTTFKNCCPNKNVLNTNV